MSGVRVSHRPPDFRLLFTKLSDIKGDVRPRHVYDISRRAIFERFLTDGRVERDSNIVERATRP